MSHWTLVFGPRRYPLGTAPLVVGRGDDADVQLRDPSVSRRHATVRVAEAGPVVEDAGSRHGLVVDGRKVAPGGSASVAHGARIVISGHELRVEDLERLRLELARTIEVPRRERKEQPADRGDAVTGELDAVVAAIDDVDAALRAGKIGQASQLTRGLAVNVRNRGSSLEDALLDRGASLMLEVAVITDNPQWVDDVVHLLAARARLIPVDGLEHLEGAIARAPSLRTMGLRTYAQKMQAHYANRPTTEAERRALERLLGLIR